MTFSIDYLGKVVIVTGGGSGIGRATARSFASSGAHVAVADLSEEGGNETISLIKEAGRDGTFIKTDVSEANEVINMIKKQLKYMVD